MLLYIITIPHIQPPQGKKNKIRNKSKTIYFENRSLKLVSSPVSLIVP